ncbi:MAG: ATP-binding protein [Nitrospiraceae bacterium]
MAPSLGLAFEKLSRQSRFVLLQSLVTIIFSYQLLFSQAGVVMGNSEQLIVLGLLAIVASLMVLPSRVLEADWFPGVLVTGDTLISASTVYLSGNARSDFYVAFFLLILIAASVPTLKHMLGLSIVLCIGYGAAIWYAGLHTGALTVGHWLGIPVLLIMAIFYGVTAELALTERKRNIGLLSHIDKLEREERLLLETRDQLAERVKDLKAELLDVNQELSAEMIQRHALEAQLRQAQKMEAVGRLTGVMADGFTRILTTIGTQAGRLLTMLSVSDPGRAYAEEIFEAGDRATTLTNQLLVLRQPDILQPETISLNTIVDELQWLLRELVPDGVDLCISLHPQGGSVATDRGQLEQAIMHLIINAREAMPRGGSLAIETGIGPLDRSFTSLDQQVPPGSYAKLTVRDTGCGMSQLTQVRMFEPFFSTKHEGDSTGLGLATVYGILKQCHGHIRVESRPGRGTAVTIAIPLIQEAGDREVVSDSFSHAERELLAKGAETILIVEEQEILRKLARATLRRYAYQVLEATTAVEALVVSQEHQYPIQLVVSNLLMPDINGQDLTNRLRRQHPDVKALYMSGYSGETILQCYISGRHFIRKPYTQRALTSKVREVLDIG